MSALSRLRVVTLFAVALTLGACQVNAPNLGATASRAGFKANYLVARVALEKGQYGKAERGFASLLKKAGPFEPRIRLEYAHALLRAGKLTKASDEARVVAAQLDGRGRVAALAVQATADQEIARAAINRGVADADSVQRLVSAKGAFDELLTKYPDMDPLGALALRRRTIDVELSTIN